LPIALDAEALDAETLDVELSVSIEIVRSDRRNRSIKIGEPGFDL
jgi:hypothetical protein